MPVRPPQPSESPWPEVPLEAPTSAPDELPMPSIDPPPEIPTTVPPEAPPLPASA